MALDSYQLRCTLHGHSADVRSVNIVNNFFITGSRDATAKLWKENGISFSIVNSYEEHTSFVSSLACLPPSDEYPSGLLFTGCNDKKIRAYTLNESKPLYTLSGHTHNVCALSCDEDGSLLSGSWDNTAKLWINKSEVLTLHGHEAAVWSVLIVSLADRSGQKLVTASADKSIRMWSVKDGSLILNINNAHTDCVRSLVNIPSRGEFLSCSNDASVRRWNFDGVQLSEYYAHSNFIYSVFLLPNQREFISCGEDRTLRVWNLLNGECIQTIVLPCQSAWSCAALCNGDVVVGCSDATIRVFSRDLSRQANEQELYAFREELASTSISGDLGDIEPDKLSGIEALQKPGKQEGQVIMIKEGSSITCYQWSTKDTNWMKVGDVVGSQSKGRQKTLDGQEYDFVFDVDIQEGEEPLKIGCNRTDDPWHVAQAFIYKHNLSQLFLDQIAKFLITNTGNVFESNQKGPFVGGGSDPFTGESSYHTNSAPTSTNPPNATSVDNRYFPKKNYLRFDDIKIAGLTRKLQELSLKYGISVDSLLLSFSSAVNHQSVSLDLLHGVYDILKKWPCEEAFPLLDMLRWLLLDSSIATVFLSKDKTYLSHLVTLCNQQSPANNQLTGLKCLVNCFQEQSQLPALLLSVKETLLHVVNDIGSQATNLNANVQVALASLLLNMSVFAFHEFSNHSVSQSYRRRLFEAIHACLQSPKWDAEAKFRLCVALGTLVEVDKEMITLAKSTDIIQHVSACAEEANGSIKLVEVAILLLNLF